MFHLRHVPHDVLPSGVYSHIYQVYDPLIDLDSRLRLELNY